MLRIKTEIKVETECSICGSTTMQRFKTVSEASRSIQELEGIGCCKAELPTFSEYQTPQQIHGGDK
jgi:hypothetical protein